MYLVPVPDQTLHGAIAVLEELIDELMQIQCHFLCQSLPSFVDIV